MENGNLDLVDSLADKDICPSTKITSQFSLKYVEAHSSKISTPEVFCSPIFAENHSKIVSVFTDGSLNIINKQTFEIIKSYQSHKKEVTDARFSPLNPELIYSSSLSGHIDLYDCRTGQSEKTLSANTDGNKALTAFDVCPKERLLCAGTELIEEDSFLLFWDIRNSKILGGYWESHSDEISCVKFNPDHPNTLASAGTDGLLNIFDTSLSTEDDAFTYCLNTNDTVKHFYWRSHSKKSNILAFTDVMSIQLWDIEEAGPSISCSREEITKSLLRTVAEECYPVPMINSFTKNILILAASGLEHLKEPCLRILRLNEKSKILEPYARLIPSSKKCSSPVQGAIFNPETESIITLTEDGVLSKWNLDDPSKLFHTKMKISVAQKRKNKPY